MELSVTSLTNKLKISFPFNLYFGQFCEWIMNRPLHRSLGLIIFVSSIFSIWYVLESRVDLLPFSFSPFHYDFNNINEYFEDKYFKRVLNCFKKYSTNISVDTKLTINGLPVPTFLLVSYLKTDQYWQNQLHHITSNECPLQCTYTRNLSESTNVDAILIHLDSFKNYNSVKKYLPNRDPDIPWVMLTFETHYLANKFIEIDYEDFNNVFNRTMTFRKDADVIVNHGFVVSKNDATLLPYHWRITTKLNSSVIYKPNSTVIGTMISNCNDKSGRLKYIKDLQKHINVDVYGKCGTLECGKSMYVTSKYKPHTDKCLRTVGTRYMFYLAFENSFCKDYGSEKIYNLLYYPIVPIVYGGINYEEILPPNSYINAAHYSPSELADYIHYLVSNKDEYKKYLKWREIFTPSTIGGERIMCDLCTRLYDPEFYKYNVIKNFTKWYVSDANCFKYGI